MLGIKNRALSDNNCFPRMLVDIVLCTYDKNKFDENFGNACVRHSRGICKQAAVMKIQYGLLPSMRKVIIMDDFECIQVNSNNLKLEMICD